jgi:hypothetical protein
MATSFIDHDWKFQVEQVTRVLEKYGAEKVIVWRYVPNTTYKYSIAIEFNDRLLQFSGDNLPRLTETAVKHIAEAEPNK